MGGKEGKGWPVLWWCLPEVVCLCVFFWSVYLPLPLLAGAHKNPGQTNKVVRGSHPLVVVSRVFGEL